MHRRVLSTATWVLWVAEILLLSLLVYSGFQLLNDSSRLDPPGGWLALAILWSLTVIGLVSAQWAARQPETQTAEGPGASCILIAGQTPVVMIAILLSVMDSGMS